MYIVLTFSIISYEKNLIISFRNSFVLVFELGHLKSSIFIISTHPVCEESDADSDVPENPSTNDQAVKQDEAQISKT